MEHLAQDLTIALEESESCGPINFDCANSKWGGMRRRTRSAGNLHLYLNKSADNRSDEDSSSNSELQRKIEKKTKNKLSSFHQSDSDELSLSLMTRVMNSPRNSLRMKNPLQSFLRGRYIFSHSLESDSVNEHSPAKPNLRRKRKLKRMNIDETPIPPTGKRKRAQRFDLIDNGKYFRYNGKIKPLHPTVVDKIEKFCQKNSTEDGSLMETQSIDENYEVASESSISWSGGEGHEGDDELTDWAPSVDNPSTMDQTSLDYDPREIRAGCRRLGDERPGFSISTGANEKVAKFLHDTSKTELRLFGTENEKLGQLAALYSLELRTDGSSASSLLVKTNKTPCMQPTQRHHSGLFAAHKRIRTQDKINIFKNI